MEIRKPEYIRIMETYNLGKIRRSYSLYGELLNDIEIEVLLSYEKITLSKDIKIRKDSKFILGEHLSFKDFYNARHEYFSYHEIYGGTFSKWTAKDGEIKRELRKRDFTKGSLDSIKFEDDIINKLKSLPKHVRDVIGI